MAGLGGDDPFLVVAGDEADPADAAHAADAAAAAALLADGDGNQNHMLKAENAIPILADLSLREAFKICQRIKKEELRTYHHIPGYLHQYGPDVWVLIFELYEALEHSARVRRRLLKLLLDGHGEKSEAVMLRDLLKDDEHILRSHPDEIFRLKNRNIVKVDDYMLSEPALLPKVVTPKKLKRSKK